jgi:hypothetical protein
MRVIYFIWALWNVLITLDVYTFFSLSYVRLTSFIRFKADITPITVYIARYSRAWEMSFIKLAATHKIKMKMLLRNVGIIQTDCMASHTLHVAPSTNFQLEKYFDRCSTSWCTSARHISAEYVILKTSWRRLEEQQNREPVTTCCRTFSGCEMECALHLAE